MLGAGASANALPVVKDSLDGKRKGLIGSMNEIIQKIKRHNGTSENWHDNLALFRGAMEWLCREAREYESIDVYARALRVKNDFPALERLKATLGTYFLIEQLNQGKLDKRYKAFLASLYSRGLFPPHVKILTWNYDFQLQLAAELYRKEEVSKDSSSGVTCKSPGLLNYYPPIGNVFPYHADNPPNEGLDLIHLNGIAGIYNLKGSFDNRSIFQRNDRGSLDVLLDEFTKTFKERTELMTFCFEEGGTESCHFTGRRLRFAMEMVQGVNVLVVIGYSFPGVNKSFDEKIMEALAQSNSLHTVYVQSPESELDFPGELYGLPSTVKVVHIRDIREFYIPRELY